MSEIGNRLEDAWDAWLQTEENEVAADLAAVQAGGGPPDAEHDDSSAAHHEADLSASHDAHGSADQAAEIDNMGYTTTEEMMTDNMTAEDLPTFY